MKLTNENGESVYYNCVVKHDLERYVIKAIDGQTLPGRDRQKRKSRTFSSAYYAERYLKKLGYV